MELRDEILPRAQNIQSRLDRQTIETEEVQDGLDTWSQMAVISFSPSF